MASINPQKIAGNWRAGVALDVHTTSSTFTGYNEAGHPTFDTARSELGALLHRLKYRADQSAASEIIMAAAGFLTPHRAKVDLIVPVPPSAARAVQPVIVLANGVGSSLGIPVVQCVTPTRPTTQLKSVDDAGERMKLLEGLYAVDNRYTVGKNVLLFDDLFRSGATMNAIAELLKLKGGVASIRVLTITRTRSNQ